MRFIYAIKGRTPFRIAKAGRFPAADLRTMLRNGTIDPTGSGPPPALVDTASSTDELWPGQPKPVPALIELARAALAKWSPSTHWLHHGRFREAIHTVLLVSARLQRLGDTKQR